MFLNTGFIALLLLKEVKGARVLNNY